MSESKTLERRQKQMIKAVYLTAVLACGATIGPAQAQAPAQAQTTDWTANGETSLWSESANWNPQNVPGAPNETARFSNQGNSQTSVDIDVETALSGVHFTESTAYDLNLIEGEDVYLLGSGIVNQSNQTQTFNINSSSTLSLQNEAGISGDVEINLIGDSSYLDFYGNSSAGSALINVGNGGAVTFSESSTAINATIFNSGRVDISGVEGDDDSVAIGSLSGSGSVFLGGSELILGNLNQDDEISGVISDGELGGRLTKVGTGTLTLSGESTYAGDTNVQRGTLQLSGLLSDSHVVVDEDATFNVVQDGVALNGVTNSGTTNVIGGFVYDDDDDNSMLGGIGVRNNKDGVLTVSGVYNEGEGEYDLGLVIGRNVGVMNLGQANINDGGVVISGQLGVINGLGFNESGENVQRNPDAEMRIRGTVVGGQSGAYNVGTMDVLGGTVVGGEFGIINDEDAELNISGAYDEGEDQYDSSTVRGGNVEDRNGIGVVNMGTANVNGGSAVYGGLVGIYNTEGAELNISGFYNEDEDQYRSSRVEGGGYDDLENERFGAGVVNMGTANIRTGSDVWGGATGVVNGLDGLDAGEIDEPSVNPNARLNIDGGRINGGSVGVENYGVTNVNAGGTVIGGDPVDENDSFGTGIRNYGVTNVNSGGDVTGTGVGVSNATPYLPVFVDGEPYEETTSVINVNAGGSVSGGNFGIVNGTNSLANISGVVSGGQFDGGDNSFGVGIQNSGVTNINDGGFVIGEDVGVSNTFLLGRVTTADIGPGETRPTLNLHEGGSIEGRNLGLDNFGFARIDGVITGGQLGASNYGHLTGSGFIINGLANDGVLQPGSDERGTPNRYSALNVNGDVSFSDYSTFITNIYGNQNSQLLLTGEADLGGSVEAHVDGFGLQRRYELVVTGEGLNESTFNGDVNIVLVDEDNNFTDADGSITGEVSYDDYIAYLTLNRVTSDLNSNDGLTPNQRALARVLDDFYNNLSDEEREAFFQSEGFEGYNDFFTSLYSGNVPSNLSAANGEGLTGLPVGTQAAARRFMERLLDQIQQQSSSYDTTFAAAKAPRLVYNGTRYAGLLAQATAQPIYLEADQFQGRSRSNVWATIGRANDDVNSDGNNAGFDIRATEYQVGYTHALTPRTVLGLSLGKSDGRFDANDSRTKGDTDTTSFGAAVRYDSRNWYATGGLGYNRHSIDSERRLGGVEYSGDTDGRTLELSGEIGKKMVSGGWKIEPNISLNLANTRLDGYRESGGAGALSVGSGKLSTRRVGLGVRIASNNVAAKFRPYLSAAYQREFGDRNVDLNNTLAGIGSFEVQGTELGRNIWKLRLGADARVNDRLSIIGEIGGSWRDNQDSQYIFGGVKYGF